MGYLNVVFYEHLDEICRLRSWFYNSSHLPKAKYIQNTVTANEEIEKYYTSVLFYYYSRIRLYRLRLYRHFAYIGVSILSRQKFIAYIGSLISAVRLYRRLFLVPSAADIGEFYCILYECANVHPLIDRQVLTNRQDTHVGQCVSCKLSVLRGTRVDLAWLTFAAQVHNNLYDAKVSICLTRLEKSF